MIMIIECVDGVVQYFVVVCYVGLFGLLLFDVLCFDDIDIVFVIQQCVVDLFGEFVGGWKCVLLLFDCVIFVLIFVLMICEVDVLYCVVGGLIVWIELEIVFVFDCDLFECEQLYDESDVCVVICEVCIVFEVFGCCYVELVCVLKFELLVDG